MNNYAKRSSSRSAALCVALLLSVGGAFAQSACFSVQQNGTKIASLGSAWHTLSNGAQLTLEFSDGKAVVSNGTATVATLPCSDGGELVMELGEQGDATNALDCTVASVGYSTLYSPFQLTVPDDAEVEVYAPTYVDGKLLLTDDTRLAAGTVIAPETGLILKNAGTLSLSFSNSDPASVNSALSGSSLKITTSSVSGQTIYTLGHAKDDASLFGFFKYTGSTLAAGKAYFVTTDDAQSSALAYVPFYFGDDVTGISDATSSTPLTDGKYLEKGQVVIVKSGKKYNVSGNRIR